MIAPAAIASNEITVDNITITAYALPGHFKTSSGKPVRVGMIALSRDLERKYKLKFGDVVFVHGVGKFIFEDRMPKQWSKRMDIYLGNYKQAIKFGKKRKTATFIKKR